MDDNDKVKWMLEHISGGLADELRGLNVDGGVLVLTYAYELLLKWSNEAEAILPAWAIEEAQDGAHTP